MQKKTKAIYTVTSTYDIQRNIIFTLNQSTGKNYIEAVNSRTGEYHQIPFKNDGYNDFLYACECFIKEHFGKHLIYFERKLFQRGDEK